MSVTARVEELRAGGTTSPPPAVVHAGASGAVEGAASNRLSELRMGDVAARCRLDAALKPAPGQWTRVSVEKYITSFDPVDVRRVRAFRMVGYDRVVFEMEGRRLPGYSVRYDCAQFGRQGGLLRISLHPAHGEGASGPTRLSLPVLKRLEVLYDFEGVVVWGLEVAAPNRFRVQEFSNPPRLVVDVAH